MEYKFTLPWPPSVNGYWRSFRGRQIISKRGREYAKQVDELMKKLNLHSEQIDKSVSVSIKLNPPTLRSYDVDNFNKGIFDALSKCGFWLDDSQVQKLIIQKGEKVKDGSADVMVSVYD